MSALIHARRWANIFGSALILMFFSEYFFLNEGPVIAVIDGLEGDLLTLFADLAVFGMYYMLLTYVFLLAVQRYNVSTLLDLILAGALFGWATESVLIPIAYEAVPFSIIWPSVGWHALIDVLIGWYAVRHIMRLGRPLLTLLTFAVLGVVWGFWATWFWIEPETLQPLTPDTFTQYVFVTSAIWIIGMLIADRFGTPTFNPPKWEQCLVMGIAAILFVLVALPYLPFSLALPPVIWLTLRALRHSQADQPDDGDRLHLLRTQRPQWWTYGLAVLTPLIAAVVYRPVYEAGTGVPTEDITFILLLVGTGVLIWGLTRPWMGKSARLPESEIGVS